jgi:hypothetical protein
MVVFDLGDSSPVQLDAEAHQSTRESVLRDRGLELAPGFGNPPTDDVLRMRTSGHTESVASVEASGVLN